MELSILISSIIIAVVVLVCFRQYYRSKERRTMIEKGLDPSLLNIYPTPSGRKLFLYAGILFLAVAIGIITGIILASALKIPGETKECILLSTIISIGLSFFVCYYLSRDRKN